MVLYQKYIQQAGPEHKGEPQNQPELPLPLRQVNIINRYIAMYGPISITIQNEPGTIQLAFYDFQKGYHVVFKPAPGRTLRRVLGYDEAQWQALLAQLET